jgi:hypothetical protein
MQACGHGPETLVLLARADVVVMHTATIIIIIILDQTFSSRNDELALVVRGPEATTARGDERWAESQLPWEEYRLARGGVQCFAVPFRLRMLCLRWYVCRRETAG